MTKTSVVRGLVAALALVSASAHASLVVDTYAGAGTGGLAAVQNAVNSVAPSFSSTTSVIDFYDGSGGAGNYGVNQAFPGGLTDNFGMRVSGFFNVVTAGNYVFRSYADDGVQLKVDGVTLFSDSSYHSPSWIGGSAVLGAGWHAIEFLYFEGFGGATVELDVLVPGSNYVLLGSERGLETRTTNNVPEPGTFALFGLAALALGASRRKRK